MKRYLVLLSVIFLVVAAGAVVMAQGDGTIYACANKVTGDLREVDAGEGCRPNERALSWSVQGPAGLPCWDLNGNGVGDPLTEDVNGDGAVDVLDCQGPQGEPGVPGDPGQPGDPGAPGLPGADGQDGVSCWDLNGNGVGDVPDEDTNSDGFVDVLDCQGPQGEPGVPGSRDCSLIEPGADLILCHLELQDLASASLQFADLSGAYLNGANLAYATLEGATLRRAFLEPDGGTGTVTNLHEAFLNNADLAGAFMIMADLESAQLNYAQLHGARLDYADLTGAYMAGANLHAASLVGANLEDARLYGADLTAANLSYANLTDAQFTAYGSGYTFEADLTNVIWNNTVCPDGSESDTNGTIPESCEGHL
jgi:uncharacterized protein YjbI with pentapeptide repeats